MQSSRSTGAGPTTVRDAKITGRTPYHNRAIILALITAAGAWLRWRVTFESGIWGDEAQFLAIVGLPDLRTMLRFLTEQESHPPLFYLLMRGWGAVAGYGDRAMALLPLAFGCALPPAVYAAARRLFGARAALAAAAVAALSPTLVLRAGQIRPYSLLALLYVLSATTLSVHLFGHTRRRTWLAAALASVLMLWIHYYAVVVLAAEAAVVAFALARRWTTPARALGWVMSQGVATLLFLPWVPSLLEQMRRTGGHATMRVSLGYRLALASELFTTSNLSAPTAWRFPPNPVGVGLAAAAVLFFAVLAQQAIRERAGRTAAVLAMLPLMVMALALAASGVTDLLVSHALSILAPTWCILAGAGVAGGSRRGYLALAGVLGLHALMGGVLRPDVRSNGREMARALDQLAPPGDLLLIAPDQVSPAVVHYLSGAHVLRTFPVFDPGGPIPYSHRNARFADPVAFEDVERAMAEARAGGRAVWFVTYFPLRLPHVGRDPVRQNDQVYPHVRTYELFRSAVRILGPPTVLVTHCPGAAFEQIQALRFGPPLPTMSRQPWAPKVPPMPAICDEAM